MPQFIRAFISLLVLSLGLEAQANSGIVEVKSQPSGARVYLDGTYVGKTPYANPEVSLGQHRITVKLSDDYPAQNWQFVLDEITPQVKTFIFTGSGGGKFTGVEQQVAVERYKGNVQFASIPSGATLFINSERKRKTPIGYRDVDVGHYDIRFELDGQLLDGSFSIVRDQTVKIIADFNQGKIINRWHEKQLAKIAQQRRKQAELVEEKRRQAAEQAHQKAKEEEQKRKAAALAERRKPRILFDGNINQGIRTLVQGSEIKVPLDKQLVEKYQLPCGHITLRSIKTEMSDYAVKGFFNDKYAMSQRVQSLCGSTNAKPYYYWSYNSRRWTAGKHAASAKVLGYGSYKHGSIRSDISLAGKGTIEVRLRLSLKKVLYENKRGNNYKQEADGLSGKVVFKPE